MPTLVISKGRSLLCWYTRVVKDIPQELVTTVLKRSTRKVDLTSWPRVKTGATSLFEPSNPSTRRLVPGDCLLDRQRSDKPLNLIFGVEYFYGIVMLGGL